MKLNLLFLFLARKKEFIINSENPTCKNCIFFKEHSDLHNKYHLGKCSLFGVKDNISGEIKYEYARTCRITYNLCGINGQYYKEL